MTTTKPSTKIEKNHTSASLVIAGASYKVCLVAAHRACADVIEALDGHAAVYVDTSYRASVRGHYAVVTVEYAERTRKGQTWAQARVEQEQTASKALAAAAEAFA